MKKNRQKNNKIYSGGASALNNVLEIIRKTNEMDRAAKDDEDVAKAELGADPVAILKFEDFKLPDNRDALDVWGAKRVEEVKASGKVSDILVGSIHKKLSALNLVIDQTYNLIQAIIEIIKGEEEKIDNRIPNQVIEILIEEYNKLVTKLFGIESHIDIKHSHIADKFTDVVTTLEEIRSAGEGEDADPKSKKKYDNMLEKLRTGFNDKDFSGEDITEHFMNIIYKSYDTITNRLRETEGQDKESIKKIIDKIEDLKKKVSVPEMAQQTGRDVLADAGKTAVDAGKAVATGLAQFASGEGGDQKGDDQNKGGGRKTRKYRGGYQYSKSRKRRNSISKGKRKNPSIGKGIGKSISKSIGKSISKRKRKRRRSTLKGKNIGRRSKRNSIRKR